jgi:hypothetical protein
MSHRIRCALFRTLTLALALLAPATGRRRRELGAGPPEAPAVPRSRPRRQSPYREAPFADAGPLVRPYLLAYEQQERRTALALALDGIDIGPWVIHGHEVGAPVMGVAA